MRHGLELMRELGTPDDDIRAVGGGARSDRWLRLQADVYGRPIRRTVIDEGPANGAALLAGLAAGVFAGVDDAIACTRSVSRSIPRHPRCDARAHADRD